MTHKQIYWKNATRDVEPDYPRDDIAFCNYVAGLSDGEGSFWHENGTKKFRFAIKMKDEKELMERLQNFFECGRVYSRVDERTDSEMWLWRVADTRDLASTIIPFFEEFKMYGTSQEQFLNWRKEFWETWEA